VNKSLNVNWYKILSAHDKDVNKMWGCFKDLLLHNVHKYIPLVYYFNKWKKSSWRRPLDDRLRIMIIEGKRGYGPDLLRQGIHNI